MRVSVLLTLLASAMVLSACGAAPAAKEEAGNTTPTVGSTGPAHPDGFLSKRGSRWYLVYATTEPYDRGSEPLVKALDVFSESGRAEDRFPRSARDLERPEGERYDDSRLLLAGVGKSKVGLYAVPTRKDLVCIFLVDAPSDVEGGGCDAGLREKVSWSMSGDNERFHIYGLVANDVGKVYVVSAKKTLPAMLSRNGFFFEADAKALCPDDVQELLLVTDTFSHRVDLGMAKGAGSYDGCR